MAVCVRSSCWQQSLELLRMAKDLELPFNAVTHDLALKASVYGQQPLEATWILRETRQHVLKKSEHD